LTEARSAGVVVDTMVISWILMDQRPYADAYKSLIDTRPLTFTFQTVMELRYGALHANWGELRRRRLDRDISQFSLLQADDELSTVCAELRHRCSQIGHALGDKIHDGDRWIAAAAIRLSIPLVSDDGVFAGVPDLELITARHL
jgi:predicted nucleic acid-binding protein